MPAGLPSPPTEPSNSSSVSNSSNSSSSTSSSATSASFSFFISHPSPLVNHKKTSNDDENKLPPRPPQRPRLDLIMATRPHSLPTTPLSRKHSHRKSQSFNNQFHPRTSNTTVGMELITPVRATTAATPQSAHYHPPPLVTTNLHLNYSAPSSSSSTNSTSPSILFSPTSLLDAITSLGRGRPSLTTPEDPSKASWDTVKYNSLALFARRPSLSKAAATPIRRNTDGQQYDNISIWGSLWGVKERSEDDIVYSVDVNDYKLSRAIGYGATATVYQATYRKCHHIAIKIIDMDRYERHQIDQLRKEIQIMSLCRHENILPVYRSFVRDSKLHIVTKLMTSGSLLDVLRASGSTGLNEASITAILKQCLQGLNYLHSNMLVHRDVKSANLLLDRETGHIVLADFGVSGHLSLSHTPRKRTSFVGTPCWMAPEVIEQRQYDCRADMWSVGITALELAYGRAPSWRLAPVDVLIRTLQYDAPTLEHERCGHLCSSLLKDLVDCCLAKDPSQRPTASELLQYPVIRRARHKSYLVAALGLDRLSILENRAHEIARSESTAAVVFETWDFTAPSATPLREVAIRSKNIRINAANPPGLLVRASSDMPLRSPPSSAPIPIPTGRKFRHREEIFGCGLEVREEIRGGVGIV